MVPENSHAETHCANQHEPDALPADVLALAVDFIHRVLRLNVAAVFVLARGGDGEKVHRQVFDHVLHGWFIFCGCL